MKQSIFCMFVIGVSALETICYASSAAAQPPPASVIIIEMPSDQPGAVGRRLAGASGKPGAVRKNVEGKSGEPGSGEDIVRRRIRAQDVQRIADLEVTQRNWRGINALFPILPFDTIPLEDTGRIESQFLISNIATARPVCWVDPDFVAVGYDYFVDNGPKVTSVEMPPDIGDNMYDLWLFDPEINDFTDSGIDIVGGEKYTFPEPVDTFSIRGIEVSADLSSGNETVFPTGLTFESKEEINMRIISVIAETGI